MNTAERLKELREKRGLSQEQLAKIIGVDRTTIVKYETGASRPTRYLKKIAHYFDVTTDYLLGDEDITPKKVQHLTAIDIIKIPLLGRVVAGDPQEAIQEADEFIYIPSMNHRRSDDYFALRVNGESMEPNLMDGDIAIVHIQPDVESGQIAVVLIDNQDSTVKRVFITPDGITLVADNPAVFSPRFFTNDDCLTLPVKILGRVISIQREM